MNPSIRISCSRFLPIADIKHQRSVKMKNCIGNMIVVAAIFAAMVSVQANASVRSKSIVVEFPSDLPELAQGRAEAMYLHHTRDGQVILYLEKGQGRQLAILDVTDPAHIQAVGQVSIAASSPFDFVQDLANAVTLIRYRDQSGFAVISFRNYKLPVLTAEPDYLHPANAESDGPDGLLLISANGPSALSRDPQYQILSISGSSGAAPLATVQNVIQRVDRPQTGTIFLLNDQGVTVVRSLAAEREHQTEEWQKEGN
jgi:hypothetical protein